MGAGSATANAVQQQPPARAAKPSPRPLPSLPSTLARLNLQLGDREKVETLLAELADAIDEMREGGPLRVQLNVRPDVRASNQSKVAGVALQRDERLW